MTLTASTSTTNAYVFTNIVCKTGFFFVPHASIGAGTNTE